MLKTKLNTVISIGGLTVGLACFLLISLSGQYELSYDRFHRQSNDIYRVVEDITLSGGTNRMATAAGGVGPALVRDFPEVQNSVRFKGATMLVSYGDNRSQENNIYFTDPEFFKVFDFPLVEGDPNTALATPYCILLSRETAHRYFGNEDPIGKTLVIDKDNAFKVTGVFEDVPPNSHLQFDILLSMATMEAGNPGWSDAWFWTAFTYIQLNHGFDKSNLENKLPEFITSHIGNKSQENDQSISLSLQPLLDIHLHSNRTGEPETMGNISNVYLFSLIGAFILLIACVNFINLTIASASGRVRETGLRKVLGSSRLQLTKQFLAESVLITFGAGFLAIIIGALLLPVFDNFVGKPIALRVLFDPFAIGLFCCALMVVSFLSGGYPAFLFSRFRPAEAMRGTTGIPLQHNIFNKGLIVFQFCTSVVLIVATLTVFSQLKYMQHQDLGYNQDQVLVLSFGDDDRIQQQSEGIKQELLQSKYVDSATVSSHVPGKGTGSILTDIESADGTMQSVQMNTIAADYDFLPFYDINLIAGRSFSLLHSSDPTDALIINESGALKFGFGDPQEIVGKQFSQNDRTGKIIGVVKDFHYASLHQRIEPLTIRMRPQSLTYLSMKIHSGELAEAIADMEQRWKEAAPYRPFDYFFLDEQFNRQYLADIKFGQLFVISAMIAIILACLGLFGLASYTMQQRTKEIGVRKVLGCSVTGVITLLTKDFIKLVLLAILIASPVAWYVMDDWLAVFPYRIQLQGWMFALAAFSVLLVASFTVSFQSIKSALTNPADVLKNS